MKKTRPVLDRLLDLCTPVPESGCWLWVGATYPVGYGLVRVGSMKDGTRRVDGAHRVSWQAHNGPIPDGMHVLHKCDVRQCINPNHLFLGDRFANMADMVLKGRNKPYRGGSKRGR